MIKALGTSQGRPVIILGLSRGNCTKLLEGKPIKIDLRLMKLESKEPQQYDFNYATICLCGGETELAIIDELSKFVDLPKESIPHDEEN